MNLTTVPNEAKSKATLARRALKALSNPFVYILLGTYIGSAYLRNQAGGPDVGEAVSGLVVFALLGALTLFFALKIEKNPITIKDPKLESKFWIMYLGVWMVVNLALWESFFKTSGWLSNGLSFWGLLVFAPAAILYARGYRPADLGLTFRGFKGNLRVTLLSAVVLGGFLLLMTPGGRFLTGSDLPLTTILLGLAASFGLSFIFAGFHEEFFFRAILQTRLTEATGSRLSGIAISTLLFGLYHLPFRLHAGITEGDLVQSLAICFTETILAAFVLSALWARTRNLLAPVILHSVIDMISGSEMFMRALGMIP